MTRLSGYILGRREALRRFKEAGQVRVSAIRCLAGTRREWVMYVETSKTGPAKPPALYRINVRAKEEPV